MRSRSGHRIPKIIVDTQTAAQASRGESHVFVRNPISSDWPLFEDLRSADERVKLLSILAKDRLDSDMYKPGKTSPRTSVSSKERLDYPNLKHGANGRKENLASSIICGTEFVQAQRLI